MSISGDPEADWPSWRVGSHLLPGIIAVALFGVLAVIVLGTPFGSPAGFPDDVSIVEHIGYALFNIDLGDADLRGESFLVAFLVIALVLDAALEGSIMLAERDDYAGGTVEEPRQPVDGPAEADGGETE